MKSIHQGKAMIAGYTAYDARSGKIRTREEQDEGGNGQHGREDGTPVHAARPHKVLEQHLQPQPHAKGSGGHGQGRCMRKVCMRGLSGCL